MAQLFGFLFGWISWIQILDSISFVTQSEKALDVHYNKEREKTSKRMNSKSFFQTLFHGRRNFEKLHKKIVLNISKWVSRPQKLTTKKLEFLSEVTTFKVHEIYQEKSIYFMTFCAISREAKCSFHMFGFFVILCRNVLVVFIKKNVYCSYKKNVYLLPFHYIQIRWIFNAHKEKAKGLANEEFQ